MEPCSLSVCVHECIKSKLMHRYIQSAKLKTQFSCEIQLLLAQPQDVGISSHIPSQKRQEFINT